ncbi:MAG: hypothetical protein K1X78_16825 [Verrucomicrobiaceae bacterium]|nr:hypothetical protein [Verrucomicrobiaceae bacterium]
MHSPMRHSTFHIRHLAASLLLVPCALLAAAPPPELTVLRTQYEKLLAERVTAPFDAAKADLDAKFTAALDRIADEAKKEGKLDAVLAILEDKKRLASKFPLPEDDDATPDSLKKLRVIYREQLQKLEEQRTANHGAILPSYTAKLQALETTLTKADRVDEAKEVMTYREALATPGSTGAATPPMTAEPRTASASTAGGAANSSARIKGDDRKAAEWVLGYAVDGTQTSVTVKESSGNKTCRTAAELPKGKFVIVSFHLDGWGKPLPKPVTDEDMMNLAGLAGLKWFQLNKIGITDEGLRFAATCPELERVVLHNLNLTDGMFPHLTGLKKLNEILFNNAGRQITGVGLIHIKAAPLTALEFLSTGFSDEGMPHLASFKQLRRLSISGTPVTDAGLATLAGMKSLVSLHVLSTSVTIPALINLKGLDLSNLSVGSMANWKETSAQLPSLAAAFPNVVEFTMPRGGTFTGEDLAPLAAAFPKLKRLTAQEAKLEAGAAQAIAKLAKLEELNVWKSTATDDDVAAWQHLKSLHVISLGGTQITDAALEVLARHKPLDKLDAANTQTTPAGLAAFKKKRPDVKM